MQIRLGFSYSDRPQYHSGLFSGLFKKFDKSTGVIQAKVCDVGALLNATLTASNPSLLFITYFVQGSPRCAWSPIHVEDLGRAYAAIIAAEAAAVKGQAFNVCGDEPVDNGMVASAVAKVSDLKYLSRLHKGNSCSISLHLTAAGPRNRPRQN